MGKVYGASVVGEEAAAAAMKGQKKANRYGEKVLGAAVDQSPEAEAKRADLPGLGEGNKAKGADDDSSALQELMLKYATDDGYLSINNVKQVLNDMPAAFDRVLGWEMGREDGPRIGALTHFIGVESQRTGGPRATVLKNLETTLAARRSKGD